MGTRGAGTVCSAPTMQTGERMRVLRQQKHLLAGVDQAADGEHRIVFADVGIKENGIAAWVDHFVALRPGVAGADVSSIQRGGRDHASAPAMPRRTVSRYHFRLWPETAWPEMGRPEMERPETERPDPGARS